MKNGLLIINLGTPDAANKTAIRRYLREFLSDKWVIDLPAIVRYLLIYGIILPSRLQQVVQAYQAIWMDQGSPLLVHSRNLQNHLQTQLGNNWKVALGMRYGNPSISQALNELACCEKLTILPLYPQYSSAATGSAIEKTLKLLAKKNTFPSITLIRDFYLLPEFINAQANLLKSAIAHHDYFLFSYHGVPERQIIRGGCHQVCSDDCPPIDTHNQRCYKAQCHATARAIAKTLNLPQEKYGIAFQSRIGKSAWIRPYMEELLPLLAKKGIKRLAISCPSFVADCLETLEEIGLRAKKHWQQLGGEQLTLIPCVNDSKLWVKAILKLLMTN